MKAKTKKIIAGSCAMTLVAAVAIGATYAYLTATTEERANNFTFSTEGLDAEITEPEWDGVIDYDYDVTGYEGVPVPVYDYIDDDNDKDTPDKPVYYYDGDGKPHTDIPESGFDPDDVINNRPKTDDEGKTIDYGDTAAQDMIPGSVAMKNPKITNLTTKSDEWVAAKITFVYSEEYPVEADRGKALSNADLAKVKDAIEIDWNLTESTDKGYWTRVGDAEWDVSQTFYYSEILAKATEGVVPQWGGVSEPIFNKVSVKSTASNEQIKALEDMGGFAIWIEGFASQAEAYKDYTAWKAANVTFTHTPDQGGSNNADVAQPGIIGKDSKQTTAVSTTTTSPAVVG